MLVKLRASVSNARQQAEIHDLMTQVCAEVLSAVVDLVATNRVPHPAIAHVVDQTELRDALSAWVPPEPTSGF